MMLPQQLAPHFFHPQHVKCGQQKLEGYRSIQHVSGCEQVDWHIKIDKVVQDVCYRVSGNPWLIASLSEVACWAMGRRDLDLLAFDPNAYIKRFELPFAKYYVAYVVQDLLQKSVQ